MAWKDGVPAEVRERGTFTNALGPSVRSTRPASVAFCRDEEERKSTRKAKYLQCKFWTVNDTHKYEEGYRRYWHDGETFSKIYPCGRTDICWGCRRRSYVELKIVKEKAEAKTRFTKRVFYMFCQFVFQDYYAAARRLKEVSSKIKKHRVHCTKRRENAELMRTAITRCNRTEMPIPVNCIEIIWDYMTHIPRAKKSSSPRLYLLFCLHDYDAKNCDPLKQTIRIMKKKLKNRRNTGSQNYKYELEKAKCKTKLAEKQLPVHLLKSIWEFYSSRVRCCHGYFRW